MTKTFRAGTNLTLVLVLGTLLAMIGYVFIPTPASYRPPFATITDVQAVVSASPIVAAHPTQLKHAWLIDIFIERNRDPTAPCIVIDELTTIMDDAGQIIASTRYRRHSPFPVHEPTVATRALFDGSVMKSGKTYRMILEARCIAEGGIVWGPTVLTPVIEITTPIYGDSSLSRRDSPDGDGDFVMSKE